MSNDKKIIDEIREVMLQVCTQWECDFMDSIAMQVKRGRVLSEKQKKVLDKIYEKVCESPY